MNAVSKNKASPM